MESYLDLVIEFKATEKGFDKIYNKVYNSLKYFIFSYVKDKDIANDILSTTMLTVHGNIHKYDETLSEFNTWVFAIAKNNCLNHLKSLKKFVSLDSNIKNNDNESTSFKDLIESHPPVNNAKENKLQKVFAEVFKKIEPNSISGKILHYKHIKNYSTQKITQKLNKVNLKVYEQMKKNCENNVSNLNQYTNLCIEKDLYYKNNLYSESYVKNNLRRSYKLLRDHFKYDGVEQILN